MQAGLFLKISLDVIMVLVTAHVNNMDIRKFIFLISLQKHVVDTH